MPTSKFVSRYFPPFLLVLSLFCIYLFTLAPGLTWANNGSDGGDLITASYTGGVAHPTGYPLYLLIARLFQFIPIGSLAYRTNLMSAVFTALSAAFIYGIVSRTLNEQGSKQARLSALIAGYAFGLTPLVWSQAVITEVYPLHAFLTGLILYLFVTSFQDVSPISLERIRGLVLGLAMGNHVTTIFMLPLILISNNKVNLNSVKLNPASSVIRQLVWFFIGLSIYLTLPLRALTAPPVNWGNPVTLKRFWWLVSGELYRSYYLQSVFNDILGRIQAWGSLLLQQFGWLGLVLGITGLILYFVPSRLYLASIWTSLACSLFALLYSSDDSYVYLIPMYISFAIWIGLGVGNLSKNIASHHSAFASVVLLFFAGYLIVRIPGYVDQLDASKDLRAERFGEQVMTEIPKDALVFVKGDRALFTTWYYHFALQERTDLVVIAEELLHFDWYQETLHDNYPSLKIPTPFLWSQTITDANPYRPACYVQHAEQTEIDCK